MRALRRSIHTAIRSTATAGAVAAIVTACAPPPGGGQPPEPDSGAVADGRAMATATTAGGLRVTMAAGPARANMPLDLTLEVTNPGDTETVLDFPDGQRFDFEVLDGGTAVWRWAADMFFPQVLGRERIPAGETVAWSARLEEGLPAGTYTVRGTLTTSPPVEVEATFTVPDAAGDSTG